eukprot:scaffold12476_cov64-Attheya_sp.AAC.3
MSEPNLGDSWTRSMVQEQAGSDRESRLVLSAQQNSNLLFFSLRETPKRAKFSSRVSQSEECFPRDLIRFVCRLSIQPA